jgi:hypothetical protein
MIWVTSPPSSVVQRRNFVGRLPPSPLAVLLFQPCSMLAAAGHAVLLAPAPAAFEIELGDWPTAVRRSMAP